VGCLDGALPLQEIPVRVVWDRRTTYRLERRHRFREQIWREAARDFQRAGIEFRLTECVGEIRRSPGGRPIFTKLEHGVVNMVVTDRVPLAWDGGRALEGVSTCRGRYHLCVIAHDYAHAHQIPMLSVNTCVHELLHLILQDVYEQPPGSVQREARELRIDWYATRLWLLHDGGDLRERVAAFVERLRSSTGCTPGVVSTIGDVPRVQGEEK
jgi:hypothetical protein